MYYAKHIATVFVCGLVAVGCGDSKSTGGSGIDAGTDASLDANAGSDADLLGDAEIVEDGDILGGDAALFDDGGVLCGATRATATRCEPGQICGRTCCTIFRAGKPVTRCAYACADTPSACTGANLTCNCLQNGANVCPSSGECASTNPAAGYVTCSCPRVIQ